MAIDLTGIVDWLKGWFYTKEETNSYLNAKANKNLTNANMNVVTDSSGEITTEAKPTPYTHPSYTARTGKPTANQTPAFGGTATVSQVTSDATGHVTLMTDRTIKIPDTTASTSANGLMTSAMVTKLSNIEAEANKTVVDSIFSSTSTNPVQNKVISSKVSEIETTLSNLETGDVVEASALSNLGTSANASQHQVNIAINTAIGNLTSIDVVKVVSSLPTASADTLNTLYVLANGDSYDIYVTIDGNSYSWEKLDEDILDDLSISWSDVTGKPFTSVDTDLSSTSTNPVQNNVINTALSGKADTSHTHDFEDIWDNNNDLKTFLSTYYAYKSHTHSIADISNLQSTLNNKQDIGDCITSIELIPKSSDSTGAIRLYYGDEE